MGVELGCKAVVVEFFGGAEVPGIEVLGLCHRTGRHRLKQHRDRRVTQLLRGRQRCRQRGIGRRVECDAL